MLVILIYYTKNQNRDIISYLNSNQKLKINSKNIIIGTGMHSNWLRYSL